ncbi:MAG TPA: hypothetical protein VH107_00620 [Lacipirellulaceae bacterium]|nr:hypothetical protein [Lacipirellulaceae bacterium]
MRYLLGSFVLATAGLLTMSVMAADSDSSDAKKGDDGAARAEIREKIIKEFDKNGDGKLSDDERQEARQKMRELMERRHRERGDDGDRDEHPRHKEKEDGDDHGGHDRDGHHPDGHHDGQGPDGHHDGHGADGRHDGPPKMPKPEELFAKFDKDGDGKLSKEEFMALADFVHEHMPPPPPRGPRFAGERGPGSEGMPRGHFEGHFEGRLEGRFIEGNVGPEGPPPRWRDGDGPGRRFQRPDGPRRDRDGDDDGPEARRRPGPPGGGPGADGDGPPRWHRSFERDGHRGPPSAKGEDDDDDRRPPRRDRSDDDHAEKDTAVTAI